MRIRTSDDVDKFFDKFEDPSHELDLILEALDASEFEGEPGVRRYFIKRLVMKSYRLGKDHAYAATMDVIRKRDSKQGDRHE